MQTIFTPYQNINKHDMNIRNKFNNLDMQKKWTKALSVSKAEPWMDQKGQWMSHI